MALGPSLASLGCAFAAGYRSRSAWLQAAAVGLAIIGTGTGLGAVVIDVGWLRTGKVSGCGCLAITLAPCILIVLYFGGLTHDYVGLAAGRTESGDSLKKIALAMHDYHDRIGHLPKAALVDKRGHPLLSWRVALLPDLNEDALYREFHLEEAWDSPHNLKLLDRMPRLYRSPDHAAPRPEKSVTYYQVFVGPGTAFEPGVAIRIGAIPDGSSNTILVAEAGRPVPWTKPEELPYDANQPLPALAGLWTGDLFFPLVNSRNRRVMLAAMGDGTVRGISLDHVSEETLRRAIVRNDGKELGPDWN